MMRNNCWEYMDCGLEPRGHNVKEHGVCPAALNSPLNGINGGSKCGRFCWQVDGTAGYCTKKGMPEVDLMKCIQCEFLKHVQEEESHQFVLMPPAILK